MTADAEMNMLLRTKSGKRNTRTNVVQATLETKTRNANEEQANKNSYNTKHNEYVFCLRHCIANRIYYSLNLLKYSCEYPVTTALQGRLALPAIPWLKVAGATYSKIGNCDSGPHRMFYNCLSTLGSVKLTEGSGTTEGNVIDWKLYLL